MHNQIQSLTLPSVLELGKIELHAKHGHMGPYSAQFVELIALIHKQEAALSTARADAIAELHPAWVAANERADRAEREVSAAVARAVADIDLQSIEQYRVQMAGIITAALGYWTEDESIMPEYDTLALRDVAKLYAKYAALHAQAAPIAASDLHAQIMNLPCRVSNCSLRGASAEISYKQGHRDARHAAAELVSAHTQQPATPQIKQALPRWIDNAKGSDPFIDDLIAYIEGIHPTQPPAGELPVLPDATAAFSNWVKDACSTDGFKFRVDQETGFLRGYQQGRAAGIEEAAKVCDKSDKSAHPSDLADAIRALNKTGAA